MDLARDLITRGYPMRILDGRTGKLQQIPFSLGEPGRARHLEEVQLDNRNPPAGPQAVGFKTFAGHCILTTPQLDQAGVLLRINTEGCYTRGTQGSAKLLGGEATMITSGTFAYGDAGGIGGGPDQLWHVQSPAIFGVILTGGEGKGYGHRYIVVTHSFQSYCLKRDQLCQLIATDENPEVAEVVRMYSDKLHVSVQAALTLAEQLDEARPEEIQPAIHFVEYGDLEDKLEGYGIAIPTVMKEAEQIGKVDVRARTLVPGSHSILVCRPNSGGGRRYRSEPLLQEGVHEVDEQQKVSRCNSVVEIIALVEEGWKIAWTAFKDGEITGYHLLDARGQHRMMSNGDVFSNPWVGVPVTSPSTEEMARLFSLSYLLGEAPTSTEPVTDTLVESSGSPTSVEDLARALNARRI